MASDQSQQAALTATLAPALDRAWHLIDLNALRRTIPEWERAVTAIIRRLAPASASLAARAYLTERGSAGVTTAFRPVPAPSPPIEQITARLDEATKGLWSRNLTVEDIANAQTLSGGAAQKLIADTGRRTVVDAVTADRKATGWVRVARPNCCYFCSMLASRGAVYKDADTAGRDANSRFVGDGEFKFHDHCHCVARPIFSRAAVLPDHNQQWAKEWAEVTQGLSGRAARLAWRRHVEGR